MIEIKETLKKYSKNLFVRYPRSTTAIITAAFTFGLGSGALFYDYQRGARSMLWGSGYVDKHYRQLRKVGDQYIEMDHQLQAVEIFGTPQELNLALQRAIFWGASLKEVTEQLVKDTDGFCQNHDDADLCSESFKTGLRIQIDALKDIQERHKKDFDELRKTPSFKEYHPSEPLPYMTPG
jgi:hypothetical protein